MQLKTEMAILLSPPPDVAVTFQMDPFLTKGLMGSKVDQLELIKNCVVIREAPTHPDVYSLCRKDLEKFHDGFIAFQAYLRDNHAITPQTRKRLEIKYYYYIWKIAKIPSTARDICVLGCGPGFEIPFIKFLHPHSSITAIDYRNSILPDILEATNVKFIQGVVPGCLGDLSEKFDVVFSNHVMEHMIDPDAAFLECNRILMPGGHLLAALPMDGSFQTALHELLCHELLGYGGPSLLNMGIVDLGHPWKTNPSDLYATVASAGFEHVTTTTRSCAYDTNKKLFIDLDDRRRKLGELLYRMTFSPLKLTLNAIFKKQKIPTVVQKIIIRLESKVWYGGNNLKSSTAPEALVMGRKFG